MLRILWLVVVFVAGLEIGATLMQQQQPVDMASQPASAQQLVLAMPNGQAVKGAGTLQPAAGGAR